MRRFELISMFVLVILLLGFSAGLPFILATPVDAQGAASFEVVFTVGVGDQGIHYEGVGKSETLVWGPTAFTIAPDGSFWIADTPANRLLHYTATGVRLGVVDLAGKVVGANDLGVTTSNILVLDTAAMSPKVVRLALNGALLASYNVPSDHDLGHGLSGIAIGDQGQILIERYGGASVSQFVDANGRLVPTPLTGYPYGGKLYAARPADLNSQKKSQGHIIVGDRTIPVVVARTLGGLRFLGANRDGSFYVIVEELETSSELHVDQTVRHYDATGKLLGSARVPIADQYTYVAHGLAVGPDSAVYAALTRPDHLKIVRLKFREHLDSILPSASSGKSVQKEFSIQSCIARGTMMWNAWLYVGNSKYLSSTNTDGECSGRGKPRYLGGAGTYWSVPYDWGGWDTVDGFNSYMDPNTYQAGDNNTTDESCSKGVDCSGYVSRIWQLSSKHGTCTLQNVSTLLTSTNNLLSGDIMNRCLVHTVLFTDFQPNGMNAYESTTYNSYDRVVWGFSNWSRFNGYQPRRYNNVCP